MLNYPRETHLKWYNKAGRDYYKNYYNDNKDKIREYQKLYYEKNKKDIRKRQLEYYHKHYNNHEYYCKNKNILQKKYLENRQKTLDKQAYKKAYGNCIVKFNNEKKYIVSFN